MSDYGPQITAAKLYRKVSSKGTTYFVGRLGKLKVALLKSRETADDGSEIWSLVVSEAPQKARDAGRESVAEPPPTRDREARYPAPNPNRTPSDPDDVIPF